MFYHDGLRIMLPKMPATAQFLGHPPLIYYVDSLPTTCSDVSILGASVYQMGSWSRRARLYEVSLPSLFYPSMLLPFLAMKLFSNNYQLEAVSELWPWFQILISWSCLAFCLIHHFILILTLFACRSTCRILCWPQLSNPSEPEVCRFRGGLIIWPGGLWLYWLRQLSLSYLNVWTLNCVRWLLYTYIYIILSPSVWLDAYLRCLMVGTGHWGTTFIVRPFVSCCGYMYPARD